MSRRALVLGGTVLAGGAGYYFYRAGGDPQTAQKEAERDAAKLSAKVKDELPGRAEEAKKDAKANASALGSKVDSALGDAKGKGKELEQQASAKLNEARKQTGDTLSTAVDKFDKTVEEGASKAKSGISSWFGGK